MWYEVKTTIKDNQRYVWIKFTETPQLEQQFVEFLEKLTELLYTDCQPFTMLVETQHVSDVPLIWARHLSTWMRDNEVSARLFLKKTAIVASSQWVSLFLKAVFTLKKPVTDVHVVNTIKQARQILSW
jgi:hypothetical protein